MELIVTVLADDRPGVIERVAEVVAEHGGSWQDSRMAQLAGSFAGIIAVTVPDTAADVLRAELSRLSGIVAQVADAAAAPPATQRHTLQLVANDRPGIVAELTAALAAAGVNVAELQTGVEPASMSGPEIFRATITVGLTADQSITHLVSVLEGLSDDLMIDTPWGK